MVRACIIWKIDIFIFWVKSRLQTLVLQFFYTSETFFSKLSLTHLNNYHFPFFACIWKKQPPLAQARIKKKVFFSPVLRFQKFVFHFFRIAKAYFLDEILII